MTVRSVSLSCTACAILSIALAAAQVPGPVPREKEPPSQAARMREKQLPLTVTGCIRGKRLLLTHSDGTAEILNADELLLEGSKDLMQQLRRQHDNHQDELSGVAIITAAPDGSTTTDVETKSLGKKGRLTLGVREADGPTGSVRQPVRFRVTSVQHLHDGCSRL